MQVIGVDHQEGSHTAVAIGSDEGAIASVRIAATRRQIDRLLVFAAAWPDRVWAVEGAQGVGRMLAQQLVARGERVMDVPPSLSTRVRVLSGRSGRKTDAHDARAVAVVALRQRNLAVVAVEDSSRGLRLLVVPGSPSGLVTERAVNEAAWSGVSSSVPRRDPVAAHGAVPTAVREGLLQTAGPAALLSLHSNPAGEKSRRYSMGCGTGTGPATTS